MIPYGRYKIFSFAAIAVILAGCMAQADSPSGATSPPTNLPSPVKHHASVNRTFEGPTAWKLTFFLNESQKAGLSFDLHAYVPKGETHDAPWFQGLVYDGDELIGETNAGALFKRGSHGYVHADRHRIELPGQSPNLHYNTSGTQEVDLTGRSGAISLILASTAHMEFQIRIDASEGLRLGAEEILPQDWLLTISRHDIERGASLGAFVEIPVGVSATAGGEFTIDTQHGLYGWFRPDMHGVGTVDCYSPGGYRCQTLGPVQAALGQVYVVEEHVEGTWRFVLTASMSHPPSASSDNVVFWGLKLPELTS